MDPSQIDALVHRLVANPHDEQALGAAHQAGASDPKSYALLLERVGAQTPDPSYASHWLSEAANVWSTTLGDAHRAARVLMQAIERDPTQRTAAERLAQLYREKGDVRALVALLERRAKALAPLATESDEIRAELTGMHVELGRLWGESLQQPKKALDNYRRALELDPSDQYALYGAREIHKALGQWNDAFELYEAELRVEVDPARRVALLRDEAAARRANGDIAGASRALDQARQADPQDAALQQEFATTIVERLSGGEEVPPQERTLAAELLVGLAEAYDGEHGLAYSGGALDIEPGHDRALQLYAYYARALQREDDVAGRYLTYVQVNPAGAMAREARWILAASYEAVGQLDEAIQMLEPLRAGGDSQATSKLRELYGQLGRRMPSAAPQPPSLHVVEPRVAQAARPTTTLDAAQLLASAGKRDEAYAKYREVLEREPVHPEALAWAEDYLRSKRDYRALRDLLLAAVRAPNEPAEIRKERLREVAALSEGNLRDPDGAIEAWKQLLALDRGDEVARQSLTRALERTQRWDDLANLLEHEAAQEGDLEKRIALEKRLATLHEQKRRDFVGAAEAWERVTNLIPDDDHAVATASELFERAGALDRAAQVIAANAASIDDVQARDVLLERLGQLRERLGDPTGAGEAYAEAAERQNNPKLWEAAERCYVAAREFGRAGNAAVQRAAVENSPSAQARHFARAAGHFAAGGDEATAIANFERAVDLDPNSDEYAQALTARYSAASQWNELVSLLSRRSDRLGDVERRVQSRREAARLLAGELADKAAARGSWHRVLEDGEDREALTELVEDAVEREDYEEATSLLRRLEAVADDRAEKARIALREAELVADGLGDVPTAIERYERILTDLDAGSRPALQAIADLQEARDNPAAAAKALERELDLVKDPAERGPIAGRLANIYEQLGDSDRAIRALEVLRLADPDDFDALARLSDLCEKTKKWDKVAELLAQRIEVEADEGEMSALTKKLAHVLADELGRGDEALAVLTELADQGDEDLRAVYVTLGDRLGWRGVVGGKLVEWWFEAKPGPQRTAHLRGAFERFAEVGRDQEAVRVGCELARAKGADVALAHQLERLALKTNDLDALAVAHDLIARETTGEARAHELVRQAEVRFKAGAPRADALSHGEQGLTSIAPGEAEELLQRLAGIAEEATEVVDLYERQIGRCKAVSDRVAALARAAQVAAVYGQMERARGLFDLALSGSPTDDAVVALEDAAREADANLGDDRMRRTLCAALASGGQGARDGGRTRGALLRRAAHLAAKDLRDTEQAFSLLGDALVAHVDAPTLDALDELARSEGDPRRAETTLTRALAEVFDGPLVRQLLSRRAQLRREVLHDKANAALDLKKLYELSPNDQAILEEVASLLTELGDYRAMVQLYEDQILRGKDLQVRAELARKVARMWEQQLDDPREAADAWRRVLRMKQGDPEATAGLERSKATMILRKSNAPPSARDVDASPGAPDSDPTEVSEREPSRSAPAPEPVRSAPPPAPVRSAPPPEPRSAPALQARSVPPSEPRSAPPREPAHEIEARAPIPPPEEPPLAAEPPAAPTSPELEEPRAPQPSIDDMMVTIEEDEPAEENGVAQSDQTLVAPIIVPDEARREDDEEDEVDDVVIADDLAEMIDADEEEEEDTETSQQPNGAAKIKTPPPLPRT
jgi:tetratricopeptide (TPR) repeat protein